MMKFLDAWNRQLSRWSEERFYLALLSLMAGAVAVMVTVFDLGLQRNFMMIACDTAFFENATVNILHGHLFRETAFGGPSLLGLHATMVLLFLAPIYALFPSTDMLFVLQVFGVYSSVIPLYLIAQDLLRRPLVALIIAAAALANPLLFHMALAPFHPETWMLTGALWAYYFYRRNRVVGFWISLGFALSCGEHIALLFIALGLSLLWFDDGLAWRKRYGRYALVASLVWVVIAVGVIAPIMHHPDQGDLYADNYSNWGVKSASGLVPKVLQNPAKAVYLLLLPDRWNHVLALVGLPLILAFFSWRSFILLLPFPLYFLMGDKEFFLYFHAYYYQFAFFAGYMGLIFFLVRWDVSTRLGAAVLTAVFFLNLLSLFPVTGFYMSYTVGNDENLTAALHQAFDKIPTDAAVYSPHRYSAYLSNRANLVMGDLHDENLDFNTMIEGKYSTTGVHADEIDYIVCDIINDQCGWRQGPYNPATSQRRADNVNRLLKTGQWSIDFNQGDVVILRRIEK